MGIQIMICLSPLEARDMIAEEVQHLIFVNYPAVPVSRHHRESHHCRRRRHHLLWLQQSFLQVQRSSVDQLVFRPSAQRR